MKKILFFISIVLFIASCEEEKPNIQFNTNLNQDSTYVLSVIPTAQNKVSLLEDFTGVRCKNCPDAHLKAKQLADANPGRLNIISLHPKGNTLSRAYINISGYIDFNLQEASDLFALLGTDKNLPAIGLDRTTHPNKNRIYTNSVTDWNSVLTTQLAKKTPINLDIINKLIVGDSLVISCNMTATENVIDSVYLSLVLLEDNIVNPQEESNGDIDTFYVHNHVVRKFITPYQGTYLKTTFEPGRVYRKVWTIKIDPAWNLNNCNVVAFIHKRGISNEIWHSASQKIK